MKALYLIIALLCINSATALTIEPSGNVFSPVNVQVSANDTVDTLLFTLNGNNISCNNCSNVSQSMNLSPGTYTIVATQTLGNATESVNNTITVLDLEVTIDHPKNQTYTSENISVNITTNIAATISYRIDNGTYQSGCENCTAFNTTIQVQNGSHTLDARAVLQNIVKQSSTMFFVNISQITNGTGNTTTPGNTTTNTTNTTNNTTNPGNTTNTTNTTNSNNTTKPVKNETGRPYTLGLNKLPQQVTSGNLTDHELAEIIRNNKINPGIINRLIKTGKLGNESIDAIIDTQKTPKGILAKIAGFLGIEVKTAKEKIIDQYNVTQEQAEKLINDEDVSQKTKEKIEKIKPSLPKEKKAAPENKPAKEEKKLDAEKEQKVKGSENKEQKGSDKEQKLNKSENPNKGPKGKDK